VLLSGSDVPGRGGGNPPPGAGPNTRFLTAADRATRIARKTATLSDTVGQDITGSPHCALARPERQQAFGHSRRMMSRADFEPVEVAALSKAHSLYRNPL